ncbi:hypothetical protein SL003B_2122 [Polymorphum gilvum SL003B-26A1]|uniref:Histidine kinase/HSP90-like ATPase domain-containing protein n=1 Tax=Polymorphum gilvum (strain LMG 25793 / CGMCC 1.9160 / SL003B-26A1) TaxID=991905 RepID=F2IY44_POLGS|nr:hypothetical protein SL003B_2122 [Polymorphum gilvum SL003B-26A1]
MEGRPQRLTVIVLLTALVLLVTWILTGVDFPLPEGAWHAREAAFRMASDPPQTALTVTLPHNWNRRPQSQETGVYRFLLPADLAARSGNLAVFVPRFTGRIELRVDGTRIAGDLGFSSAQPPARNTSLLATVPDALLASTPVEMTVLLASPGYLSGYLETVYVGAEQPLRRAHEQRTLLFFLLPGAIAIVNLALGALLFLFWFQQKTDDGSGLLALSLTLGAVYTLATVPNTLTFSPSVYRALHGLPLLEVALAVLAIARHLGVRMPKASMLILLPGTAAVVTGLVSDDFTMAVLMLVPGALLAGLCMLVGAVLSARAYVVDHNETGLVFSLALTVLGALAAHDIMVLGDILSDRRILLVRLYTPLFSIAVGGIVALRLVRALAAAELFARQLKQRVEEAEAALRASFQRERHHLRASALMEERARLMRDLHDGVGGQLVSIVSLARQKDQDAAAIGEAARTALQDLRLVVDAMDDIQGDLMLVLATWRDRMEGRLRAGNVALDWKIDTQPGLPILDDLRPSHVLNILRILDEAVTNALKHSAAGTVRVRLQTVTVPDGKAFGRIAVEDDGDGGASVSSTGRGLGNMQERAARIGARLTVASDASGTRVQLDLPAVLPGGTVLPP